jgi:hypothetical protein
MSMTPRASPDSWALSVEHRLTVLEQDSIHTRELTTKMDKRLTLQERGLLLVIVVLNVLAHEKLPWLAKMLAGLLKAPL